MEATWHRPPACLAAMACAAALALAAPAPARAHEGAFAPPATEAPSSEPDHLRNVVEMGAFLGGGALWYWLDRDRNAVDWDFDSWTQRFSSEAYRYDNNEFPINYFWHAASGTGAYALSRTNRLGVLGSTVSGFVTSFAWEFLLEFKERVSINDQLVSPFAGLVWGEFFYKFGRYLNAAPRRSLPHVQVLRWTLGLPQSFHDALDDAPVSAEPDLAARFRLAYAPTLAEPAHGNDLLLHELAFDGELVSLRDYLVPGRFDRVFFDANVSSFRARIRTGEGAIGTELYGETTLLGLHRQRIGPDYGGLWGHALTFGTSMAYRYRKEIYPGFRDRLGLLGLPGLAVDAHAFVGRVSLHTGARLHLEFAGVSTPAFAEWQADHPELRPKSILKRHGYYYGWGGSGRLYLEARSPHLQLGASLWHGRWISQQGLDRTQDVLTADVVGRDQALDWETWLRLLPLRSGPFVELSLGEQRRSSQLERYAASARLSRYQVSVGSVF